MPRLPMPITATTASAGSESTRESRAAGGCAEKERSVPVETVFV
jgi:hypothetical protein